MVLIRVGRCRAAEGKVRASRVSASDDVTTYGMTRDCALTADPALRVVCQIGTGSLTHRGLRHCQTDSQAVGGSRDTETLDCLTP